MGLTLPGKPWRWRRGCPNSPCRRPPKNRPPQRQQRRVEIRSGSPKGRQPRKPALSGKRRRRLRGATRAPWRNGRRLCQRCSHQRQKSPWRDRSRHPCHRLWLPAARRQDLPRVLPSLADRPSAQSDTRPRSPFARSGHRYRTSFILYFPNRPRSRSAWKSTPAAGLLAQLRKEA
jgi:hypothetical protein